MGRHSYQGSVQDQAPAQSYQEEWARRQIRANDAMSNLFIVIFQMIVGAAIFLGLSVVVGFLSTALHFTSGMTTITVIGALFVAAKIVKILFR